MTRGRIELKEFWRKNEKVFLAQKKGGGDSLEQIENQEKEGKSIGFSRRLSRRFDDEQTNVQIFANRWISIYALVTI